LTSNSLGKPAASIDLREQSLSNSHRYGDVNIPSSDIQLSSDYRQDLFLNAVLVGQGRKITAKEIAQSRQPIPPEVYKGIALELISKVWGLLCPSRVSDWELQDVFKEVNDLLSQSQHYLLCTISWKFGSDLQDRMILELYYFIFHGNQLRHEDIFEILHRELKNHTGVEFTVEKITIAWNTAIVSRHLWMEQRQITNKDNVNQSYIGFQIKSRLNIMKYPLCYCNFQQPHSLLMLECLEAFDPSKVLDKVAYIVASHKSLRVLDFMNEVSSEDYLSCMY
jgi:hypothetical protein